MLCKVGAIAFHRTAYKAGVMFAFCLGHICVENQRGRTSPTGRSLRGRQSPDRERLQRCWLGPSWNRRAAEECRHNTPYACSTRSRGTPSIHCFTCLFNHPVIAELVLSFLLKSFYHRPKNLICGLHRYSKSVCFSLIILYVREKLTNIRLLFWILCFPAWINLEIGKSYRKVLELLKTDLIWLWFIFILMLFSSEIVMFSTGDFRKKKLFLRVRSMFPKFKTKFCALVLRWN